MFRTLSAPGLAVLTALMAAGCDVPDRIEERLRDPSTHERYTASLRSAGLAENTLGQAWSRAAERALRDPLGVVSPFREEGFVEAAEPRALAYAIEARRGQRISIEVAFESVDHGRVFIDLFRVPGDSTSTPFLEADLPPDSMRLDLRVSRSGTYLLRVQPELLLGGRYAIDIRTLPSLAFPVEGRGPEAVLSRFGAARDGGRRQHRGVDIFAPRGTPALAASSGTVRRVDTTNLGGYVVWIRDEDEQHSLYYAHLDVQTVREGERVRIGDTVGLVGNTGNARTTPPHLHFGVYRRREGALDPFPFVEPQDSVAASPSTDLAPVGAWGVVVGAQARLRRAPSREADSRALLEAGTPVQVTAHASEWLRVRAPQGTEGYLMPADVRSLETGRAIALGENTPLRVSPDPSAPVRRWVSAGATPLQAHGSFGGFALVLDQGAVPSWIAVDEPRAAPQ